MADFDIDDPNDWNMDDGGGELIPMEELGEKNDVIDSLLDKFGGNLDETERALMRLQLHKEDNSWFYHTELDGKPVRLKLTGRSGQVLAQSTIAKAKGGSDFFTALGPNRAPREPRVPLEPTIVQRLDIANEVDLQHEIEMIVDDETTPLKPEDRRELRGVASTLASTSSRVKSAQVNVEWADRELQKARKELAEAEGQQDEEQIKYWNEEVERFKAQEAIYRRTHEALKQGEASQVDRLKSLLRNMSEDKRTLGEKLRALFRQEGITIVSILTAALMTVTSIGLGIASALKTTLIPAPSPGEPPKSARDQVRDALRRVAQFLKALAKKGAAALPGVIGSVVSFLLKTAGSAVGFLAEHLIILVIAVVALAFKVVAKKFSS